MYVVTINEVAFLMNGNTKVKLSDSDSIGLILMTVMERFNSTE